MTIIEYRVRPVVRYIVTKYTASDPDSGCGNSFAGVETVGEFANEIQAESVAEALRGFQPSVGLEGS